MSEQWTDPGGGPGAEPLREPAGATGDPLAGYQLRAVTIGTWVTVLTIASLAGFALLPGHGAIHEGVFWSALLVSALGAIGVALLPWARLLNSRYGEFALYAWSAGDIALISVAVAATGGGRSELWAVYALTTIFFAASYPPRGQGALIAVTAMGYAVALAFAGWHISAASLMLRGALLLLVFFMAMFLARELRAEMELRANASLRARLAESQARRADWFRALVHDSSDVVTTFDVDRRLLYVSEAARDFGYDPEALIGTDVGHLVHPDDVERVVAQIVEQFETGSRPAPIEYRIHHADGSWRYFEGVATNLLEESTIGAVVVNARDVTERKRAELLLESQSDVLGRIAASEPLDSVLRRIAEIVEEHAQALCTIAVHGAAGAQLLVVSSDPRLANEGDEEIDEQYEAHADSGLEAADSGWSREIVQSDGQVLGVVRLRFASTRFATTEDQQVAELAANLAAIALEREATEARLAHQARHDSLTGLANRQVLMNTLEHALTSARTSEILAVLFVDLDGFKAINDNMGHHVGDQLLVALGHRLAAALRMHDVIARFGGDEFVALCRVEDSAEALHLAERILTRVREPITLGLNRITLDASIGVTLASVFADEGPRWVMNAAWVQAAADELLRQADSAMYRAKQHGGRRTELYEADPPQEPHLRAAGEAASDA